MLFFLNVFSKKQCKNCTWSGQYRVEMKVASLSFCCNFIYCICNTLLAHVQLVIQQDGQIFSCVLLAGVTLTLHRFLLSNGQWIGLSLLKFLLVSSHSSIENHCPQIVMFVVAAFHIGAQNRKSGYLCVRTLQSIMKVNRKELSLA